VQKDLGRFNRLILAFNVLAIILLTGAYLCLYVSPKQFYLLAFLGLGFPALFFLNVMFLLYWTIIFRIQAVFSGVMFMLGLLLIPRLFQVRFSADKKEKGNAEQQINLMSYNVRLFDLYNWTNNKSTRDKIIQFLQKQELDVVSFQEFYADDKNFFMNKDSLKEMLGMKYSNEHYTVTMRKKEHWGIATLSVFPIVSKGFIDFKAKGNNACIFTDIVKNKDTLRIYNLHLQSIHFKNEDYRFIDSLNSNHEVDEVKGIRKILGKLKRAFIKRSEQVDLVMDHINKSPYKVIVCGDFNDTPVSYTYQQFSNVLRDSFIDKGSGFGATNSEIFPQRIDYIFHDKNITVKSFKTIKSNLSDHFPVRATIQF
jgi:endonuclease/exonuclease/phosphatase family metal-dependent hydrolase